MFQLKDCFTILVVISVFLLLLFLAALTRFLTALAWTSLNRNGYVEDWPGFASFLIFFPQTVKWFSFIRVLEIIETIFTRVQKSERNIPFPNSLQPLLQSESKCKVFVMNISLGQPIIITSFALRLAWEQGLSRTW